MNYPDSCIKGIPNQDFIKDGRPSTHLFYFHSRDSRDDGWTEQSINWLDDENAIPFTMDQKKNGEIHYKMGIAIIKKNDLDHLQSKFKQMNLISYERQRLDDNIYHGNILLNNNYVDAYIAQQLAGTIALYSEYIPRD